MVFSEKEQKKIELLEDLITRFPHGKIDNEFNCHGLVFYFNEFVPELKRINNPDYKRLLDQGRLIKIKKQDIQPFDIAVFKRLFRYEHSSIILPENIGSRDVDKKDPKIFSKDNFYGCQISRKWPHTGLGIYMRYFRNLYLFD